MGLVYVPPKLTKATVERSKLWPEVRKRHLSKQPTCQACGSTTNLAVHHITPVHVDRKLELNEDNLLTLCEHVNTGYCHYIFGHLSLSWWKWDPDVVVHAYTHLIAVTAAKEKQDDKGRPIVT